MCCLLYLRWSSFFGPGNITKGQLKVLFVKPSQVLNHDLRQFVILFLRSHLFKQPYCFITRSAVRLSNSTLRFQLHKSRINPLLLSVCVIWPVTHLFLFVDVLEQGLTTYSSHDLMPVFANKIVLECSQACLFTYCLWLLCKPKTELDSCNRECIVYKTENAYDLTLHRKFLRIPALEVRSKIKVKFTCSPAELRGESLWGVRDLSFHLSSGIGLLLYWTNSPVGTSVSLSIE